MFTKVRLILSILVINLLLLFPSLGLSQAIMFPPDYIVLIQQRISSNIIYPLEARDKGWEGVVKVKFTLMPDGQVKELDIAKSSGYPLLDEAAVSAIKRASPYPSLEYYLGAEGIELILPINFGSIQEPGPPAIEQAARISAEGSPEEPKEEPIELERIEEPAPSAAEEPVRLSPEGPPQEELENFIDLAVKNNQPTQIARQEIELAQFKVREAKRNLFPALKLECYSTEGEVYKVEYEEREIKAQLDQPIFYGGRLRDSLKQAEVNLEITERNYDRLRIDVAHKSEVAYYNLVASRMNLKTQEVIRKEAKKLLQIVQNQFDAELVTSLEIASAQSWYEQIDFQIDSSKQDLALAELTFIQVLNISQLPDISRQELEIEELNLDLNECLEAGLKNRPEIYLSELLVKFNQYGKRIEESKNKFTVDLTSSFSQYQGAWKTESTNDSTNWYVGIKATKPWGASTVTTSATSEDTQPRFGQSSPTKTRTIGAEFNLLNNLLRLSDKKKAEIELQRSLSDLNETTKTINFEIKDAYLNYQKALLQATTAQSETEFRRREAEVLRVRAQVGDIGFSNVIETLVNLSRAQTTYTQALANYFISLANLKQAAGYGIKI